MARANFLHFLTIQIRNDDELLMDLLKFFLQAASKIRQENKYTGFKIHKLYKKCR